MDEVLILGPDGDGQVEEEPYKSTVRPNASTEVQADQLPAMLRMASAWLLESFQRWLAPGVWNWSRLALRARATLPAISSSLLVGRSAVAGRLVSIMNCDIEHFSELHPSHFAEAREDPGELLHLELDGVLRLGPVEQVHRLALLDGEVGSGGGEVQPGEPPDQGPGHLCQPAGLGLGLGVGAAPGPPQQTVLAEDTPEAGLPKGSWEHGLPGQQGSAAPLEAISYFL